MYYICNVCSIRKIATCKEKKRERKPPKCYTVVFAYSGNCSFEHPYSRKDLFENQTICKFVQELQGRPYIFTLFKINLWLNWTEYFLFSEIE